MTGDILPSDETELCAVIADAGQAGTRLLIQGGGSKTAFGRPPGAARVLDMRGFSGVVDYDPAELVLTVRPGTPLGEVQALVAQRGQMLGFEPFDHGPIYGRPTGAATIGGVVAAGVAGSQRIAFGGARDHLLGARAVSGRGEVFVAGAKVVKNVTGYDLPKLIAGSWGRLVAITELTLKVLPAPRVIVTQVLNGLDPAQAVAAMAVAMGSQAEVAAAAHLPGPVPVTAFRIQGFAASVAARCVALGKRLESFGALHDPGETEANAIWSRLRTLEILPLDLPLWRVNIPPSAAPRLVNDLARNGAQWVLDWAGGLVWIALEGDGEAVRQAAVAAGGHAMLMRGPAGLRARIPALQPLSPGVAALEMRLRRAFDPLQVFETDRF